MRKRTSVGLAFIVLAGAARLPSATPLPQQQEGIATTGAAQSAQSNSPTLDLGSTDPTLVVTVSIIFKAQPMGQLEAFVQSTQDPSSPTYHRFLSVGDFASRFAPSSRDIARVSAYLTTFGIQVGATLADNLVLKATGTVGAFTRAFTFQMHDFHNGSSHYHRPASAPHIPHHLSDVMLVVTGLSTQPAFVPKFTSAKAAVPNFAPKAVLPSNGTATGVPGDYTVGDFANQYDVNPLYQAGIDGTGSTIGIATLANFYPADAYTYWSSIGLTVDQDRITQIHLDGGAQLSAAAGSIETALDVEQSGGLAPGAKMVVYDAPNTEGGFLDLFYSAASDNLVDSLSVSWGLAEIFFINSVLSGGDLTAELTAFHQAFLEGAAQGISIFAAAGDSGAYDASGIIPGLSNPLTVDVPASDPAITAAGGTTTPVTINGDLFGGPTTANNYVVWKEQVWGWNGLQDFLNANEVAPQGTAWSFFATGGGGGVSSVWPAPYYQQGYPGQRHTEAGQTVTYTDSTEVTQTLFTLPAHFAGRNTPDISADADPFSGYLVYSTPDDGWNAYCGGTSFVAPQMNGVSALVRQLAGGRVGFWNPMLYRFAQENRQNDGSVVDVTAGDNWFYDGIPGYDAAAGLGVLDVQKFANAVAASGGRGCETAN